MTKTKIETTPEMKRWNAAVEDADFQLGLAAVDVDDPRKLLTLLRIAGNSGHRGCLSAGKNLERAGVAVGYFPESAQRPNKLREDVALDTRNANGSQDANPTTGPIAMTETEWQEYAAFVRTHPEK